MTRTAKITDFLGEGDFDFQLDIGQLEQLEELRLEKLVRLGLPAGEASVVKILDRLASGQALIGEVKAVLRLALIGAGMGKEPALRLVERAVVPPDMQRCTMTAYAVLAAAWVGAPNEPPGGEVKPGERKGRPAKAAGSSPTEPRPGRGSSASAPRSATRRKKPAE